MANVGAVGRRQGQKEDWIQLGRIEMDPRDRWITPEEQLNRLRNDYEVLSRPEAELKEEFVIPQKLTNWYRALDPDHLDALPPFAPPLPEDILQILDRTCPIYGGDKKIGDTHSLYLVPPGTLNQLDERVQHLGKKLFGSKNPLKLKDVWGECGKVLEQHGDTPYNDPHWILMTNQELPGSRTRFYGTQVEMVRDLRGRANIDYEVPRLRDAVNFIFLNKIATGKSLYQGRSKENNYQDTFIRVQDTARWSWSGDWRLAVGDFTSRGLRIDLHGDWFATYVGVAALCKFQ